MIWRRLSGSHARVKPVSLALDCACFAVLASGLLSTVSRGALVATLFAAAFLLAWELAVSSRSHAGWSRGRGAAALIGCLAVAVAVGWAFLDRIRPHLFDLQSDVQIRSLTAAVHWRAKIHSRITGTSVLTELVDVVEIKNGRIASYIEFFVPR